MFDRFFEDFNERPHQGRDNSGATYPPQHNSIFTELDRIMQEMLQQHFQSMNIYQTPNQRHFGIEDRSEDSNLRERMLKKPERGYSRFSDRGNDHFAPNTDVNLDNTIQNSPELLDQIFQDSPPGNRLKPQEFNPFSQIFTPQGSQNNFTFSSQTVLVTRGEDGKLKYEKREIRQDAEGNREETVTSSDDNSRPSQLFLQNRPTEYHNRIPPARDGVFERIKDWFFPPNN